MRLRRSRWPPRSSAASLHSGDPVSDRIDARVVEAGLTGPLAGPVVWATEVGSTNDLVAMRARAGAAEGLVIGADFQTAGRGRRGRVWAADPGASLLFSVLLRPRSAGRDIGLLPIAAAVGIADGLARIGVTTELVWPNDVTVAGRKLGGILCELSSTAGELTWAVIGSGSTWRDRPTSRRRGGVQRA